MNKAVVTPALPGCVSWFCGSEKVGKRRSISGGEEEEKREWRGVYQAGRANQNQFDHLRLFRNTCSDNSDTISFVPLLLLRFVVLVAQVLLCDRRLLNERGEEQEQRGEKDERERR